MEQATLLRLRDLFLTPENRKPSAINSFLERIPDIIFGVGFILVATLLFRIANRIQAVESYHDGVALKPIFDILDGKVLFRDTLYQYGTLGPYWNALVLSLFGNTLAVLKTYIALIYSLIFLFSYLNSRFFLRPIFALMAAILWIGLSPFDWLGMQPNPIAEALLLDLVGLWIFLRYGTTSRFYLILTGAVIGLAFLFRQTAGVYALAGLSVAIALGALFDLWRNFGWLKEIIVLNLFLYLGFLAATIPMFAYLAVHGALHDFYLQTVLFPKLYYIQGNAWGGTSSSLLGNWRDVIFRPPPFLRANYWTDICRAVIAAAIFCVLTIQKKMLAPAFIALFFTFNSLPNGCDAHMWWACSVPGFALIFFVIEQAIGRSMLGRCAVFLLLVAFLKNPVIAKFEKVREVAFRAELRELKKPAFLNGTWVSVDRYMQFSRVSDIIDQLESQYPNIRLVPEGNVSFFFLFSKHHENFHKLTSDWGLLNRVIYPDYQTKKLAALKNGCVYVVSAIVKTIPGFKQVASVDEFFLLVPNDLGQRCSKRVGQGLEHGFANG